MGDGEDAARRLQARRDVVWGDVQRLALLGTKDAPPLQTREMRELQSVVSYSFISATLLGGMAAMGREAGVMKSAGVGRGSADQLTEHQVRAARLVRLFVRDGILFGCKATLICGTLYGSSIAVSLLANDVPPAASYAAGGAITGAGLSLFGRLGRQSIPLILASTCGGLVLGVANHFGLSMLPDDEPKPSESP